MEFGSRIKKELTEAIVRAIFEDAGYRVIDVGIEKVLRELICMSEKEYLSLDFSDAMRKLPDLMIMDRDQTEKFLVEIKYRSGFSKELLDSVKVQLKSHKEIVLICFNSSPEHKSDYKDSPSAATYLRCCRMRFSADANRYEVELKGERSKKVSWYDLKMLPEDSCCWWRLQPIQEVFRGVYNRFDQKTLTQSIDALKGILQTS